MEGLREKAKDQLVETLRWRNGCICSANRPSESNDPSHNGASQLALLRRARRCFLRALHRARLHEKPNEAPHGWNLSKIGNPAPPRLVKTPLSGAPELSASLKTY